MSGLSDLSHRQNLPKDESIDEASIKRGAQILA